MKYIFILSLIFLASCSNSAKDELMEPENTMETEPKVNSDVNESINEDSDNQLPATIKTIHNAKFQVVEIMDSSFVKVILLTKSRSTGLIPFRYFGRAHVRVVSPLPLKKGIQL